MRFHTRGQRATIAIVQVLALAPWFAAAAVLPTLRTAWEITAAESVWLTTSVQIGFVTGALASATFGLPDRIVPQRLMGMSALLIAACTGALAAFVDELWSAIPLRFLTGMFLAGVYPVGMKLTASWTPSASRGRSFGVLLGALTLGSALPQLIGDLGPLSWQFVMGVASATAALAAVICFVVIRCGPFIDTHASRLSVGQLIALVRERRPRLINLGYLGHMWELYALWTWLPTFVLMGRVEADPNGTARVGIEMFVAIGIAGAVGCLIGGWASDRFGRVPSATTALVVSGSCCLVSPLFFAMPASWTYVFCLVWGAAVIADSGVFSTALAENIDPRWVGTALTAQTAAGFFLTVVSIQLVPLIAAVKSWQFALVVLVLGPIVGAISMLKLREKRA